MADVRRGSYDAGMDEKSMTLSDVRLRSVGYILPTMGLFVWIIGVAGPIVAWLNNTPIFNRTTGQPESALSLYSVLIAIASTGIGAVLIRVGAAIRRAYWNGKRSGF